MCQKKKMLKRQKGYGTTEGQQNVKRSFIPWGIKSAQSVSAYRVDCFYFFRVILSTSVCVVLFSVLITISQHFHIIHRLVSISLQVFPTCVGKIQTTTSTKQHSTTLFPRGEKGHAHSTMGEREENPGMATASNQSFHLHSIYH